MDVSAINPSALLLVEDNPGDVELVREMLDESDEIGYEVLHVARLGEAIQLLSGRDVDIVLLDLALPDAMGLESLQRLREETDQVPIVVLTGANDDALGLQCIEAGAQDYLHKDELKPIPLKRAIGYAISRQREQQLREMRETLARYRQLSSSEWSAVDLTDLGPLRLRRPDTFALVVDRYQDLLSAHLSRLGSDSEGIRAGIDVIVSLIGEHGGGARDLVDAHLAALDAAAVGATADRCRALAIEGRLLALEVMGLLVDHYRLSGRAARVSSHAEVAP